MSKRALQKYVGELKKKELEAQILDLYLRFPVVKEYYDFAFNPKEDKLVQAAKAKISNEYFPVKRRRPKARRSVAQKYINGPRMVYSRSCSLREKKVCAHIPAIREGSSVLSLREGFGPIVSEVAMTIEGA